MCPPKIKARHLNGSVLHHVEYVHFCDVPLDDLLKFVRKDLKARGWDGRIVSWMTFSEPDDRRAFCTQLVLEG